MDRNRGAPRGGARGRGGPGRGGGPFGGRGGGGPPRGDGMRGGSGGGNFGGRGGTRGRGGGPHRGGGDGRPPSPYGGDSPGSYSPGPRGGRGGRPGGRGSFSDRGGSRGRGMTHGASRGHSPVRHGGRDMGMDRGGPRGGMSRGGGMMKDSFDHQPDHQRMGGRGAPPSKRGRWESYPPVDDYRDSRDYGGYGGSVGGPAPDFPPSDGYQQPSGSSGYPSSRYLPEEEYGPGESGIGYGGPSGGGSSYQSSYQTSYPPVDDYRNGSGMNEPRGEYRGQGNFSSEYSSTPSGGGGGYGSASFLDERGGVGYGRSVPGGAVGGPPDSYNAPAYDSYDSYSTAPVGGYGGGKDFGPPGHSLLNNFIITYMLGHQNLNSINGLLMGQEGLKLRDFDRSRLLLKDHPSNIENTEEEKHIPSHSAQAGGSSQINHSASEMEASEQDAKPSTSEGTISQASSSGQLVLFNPALRNSLQPGGLGPSQNLPEINPGLFRIDPLSLPQPGCYQSQFQMKNNDQRNYQSQAKPRTVAKRNRRYQNDPEFREKMKTMSRERYWNDSVYREQTKERSRKRAKEKYLLEKRKSTDTVSQGTSSEDISAAMNVRRPFPERNDNSGEGPSQPSAIYVSKPNNLNANVNSDESDIPPQFLNSLIFTRKSGI